MNKFCPQCGKPVDENATYCEHCGAKVSTPTSSTTPAPQVPHTASMPPEADSIISLNNIGGVLALILAVLLLIIGVMTVIIFIGFILIVFGVVNLLVWNKIKYINALVQQKNYRQAKNEQLTWSIIGLLLGGIIIGLVLLIAYLKYDELLRYEKQ